MPSPAPEPLAPRPLSIWLVDPLEDIPWEGERPDRTWTLARVLAAPPGLQPLKAIAAGEKVDYSGASGPCDFDDKSDILDCKFRYEQIKGGKFTLVKVA